MDELGTVHLLQPQRLDRSHRAIVTIMSDEPVGAYKAALFSEAALAGDWNRPEEDAAWAYLQQDA